MKIKPIIVVNGDPKSIFLEIFFKSLKFKNFKSPILLISSLKLLEYFKKKFNFQKNINLINLKNINKMDLNRNSINLIDVQLPFNSKIKKKLDKSNFFIKKSFDIGLDLIKKKISNKLINGPVSKKKFLKKNYPGMTEYIAKKSNIKKFAMLIYNKNLSVCPLTTHIPIKRVSKIVSKKNIYEKVFLINSFYKKHLGIKPKIAVLGLNPHCESIDKFNEDEKIILPAVKYLKKKGYKVYGPFPADTIFLKKNRKKFNVILGMYHDQVLTPMKTLYEYDAINVTLGLPFFRISPDHGPNIEMIGKNKSNPNSLISALNFLDQN